MINPRLFYYSKRKEWFYQGEVVRRLKSFQDGVQKILAYNSNPERHENYFNRHNKVLGVDTTLDAWKADEPLFSIGNKFLLIEDEEPYVLTYVGRDKVTLVSMSRGSYWRYPQAVKEVKSITEVELASIIGHVSKFKEITDKEAITYLRRKEELKE